MITPNEAQALLKGTMPTPWKIDTKEYTDSTAFTDETTVAIILDNGKAPICSETVLPDELPQYRATFELMAAAPGMAKQIAGMRYEYAAQVPGPAGEWQNCGGWAWQAGGDYDMVLLPPDDPQGWSTHESLAREIADDCNPGDVRIVRRLVAEPEVIE